MQGAITMQKKNEESETHDWTCSLSPVEGTLIIPLVARAMAHPWCPWWNPGDLSARVALKRLGWQRQHWVPDAWTVGFILWRTHRMRQLGAEFFIKHPHALGVNLGAGLSDYFQWLCNGTNTWLDTDLPDVMRLRKECLPLRDALARDMSLDLSQPENCKVAMSHAKDQTAPVWMMCEGVMLYMKPPQVHHMLAVLASVAPEGSELVFDFIPSWMVGTTIRLPLDAEQAATFQWGLSSVSELEDIHPRLRVRGVEWCMPANPCSPYGLMQLTIQ